MAVQLRVDRIIIHSAPDSWGGRADAFHRLLQSAIEQELRDASLSGAIQEHELLRIDLPPVVVNDIYSMQEIAHEIARRITLALRRKPE
jgi:hypothetical protein